MTDADRPTDDALSRADAPPGPGGDGFGTPEGRRIVELLWSPPAAPHGRGPKPKLTHRQIVEAGIAIADAEGLDALSMRKVAAALSVGPMSLYTYVPGRAELIELMLDTAYAGHRRPETDRPWRERLEFLLRETWALYRRHPWVLDHNQVRLPLGPHVLDVEESMYAALVDAGFGGSENATLSNFIRWQLLGAGRAVIGEEVEERHTGVSMDTYWESRSSFWATHFDPVRYPAMFAVWQQGGFDDVEIYSPDRMIDRLLEAIERARPS